jgi:uncharacterized protein (TIGR04222 family)
MAGYFDNPIGQMPGSAFLALYSVWFILWLIVARLWGTFKKPPVSPPIRIPNDPDPFQIAYLRGGVHELLRTVLVDLVEKKRVVEVKPTRTWYQFGTGHSVWAISDRRDFGQDLSPAHRVVINGLRANACTISEIMQQLPKELQKIINSYRAPLEAQGLIVTEQESLENNNRTFISAFCFTSLGLYKLAAAFANGRTNVGYLIIGMIIGTICIVAVGKRRSLTEKGLQYLKDLRLAFSTLQSKKLRSQSSDPPESATQQLSPTLLGMGIFGAIAIQHSELHSLFQSFGDKALSSNSFYVQSGLIGTGGCGTGGCGSSGCGSGGCGSGGCGGGCGGCGGG